MAALVAEKDKIDAGEPPTGEVVSEIMPVYMDEIWLTEEELEALWASGDAT